MPLSTCTGTTPNNVFKLRGGATQTFTATEADKVYICKSANILQKLYEDFTADQTVNISAPLSGTSIATAVVIGIDREKAARFSFIMVIPLIFGSMAKSIIDNGIIFENFNLLSVLLGFISAFITGLLACKWMISLVKKSKLLYALSLYY